MNKPHESGAPISASTRRSHLMLSLVAILVLFWQSLLPFVLHAFVYALEIIEQVTDVILESLGIEDYTAQLITAWMGLAAFILLTAWIYRKISRRWGSLKVWLWVSLQRHWVSCTVLLSAFIAGAFLF